MMTKQSRLSRALSTARTHATGAGVALLLAGCGTTVPLGVDLGDYQAPPRDVLGVEHVTQSHVVHWGKGGVVAGPERRRLDAFIWHVAGNRPESLRVALHGGGPAQRQQVSDVLVADGVNPRHIAWVDRRGAQRGGVVIEVDRAIAVLPNCPGWISHIAGPEDNRTDPNFGCSDVSNLAATVADPHHLRQAASSIYEDGERAASNVADYRADKIFDNKWSKELPKSNEKFSVLPSK